MKIFRRIQAGVAVVAMWTAVAVSDSSQATGKETFAGIVLAALAGIVIVGVLIERAKEEGRAE